MKLMVGIDGVDNIADLAYAGAHELFCGIETKHGILNVKSDSSRSNVQGFERLADIVLEAHQHNVYVYLTRNLRHLSPEQLDWSFEETERAVMLGIDGVIVGNLALLLELQRRELPVKLISSCLMPAYNVEAVKFFRKLGIDRQTIPRQFGLSEICSFLDAFPDHEFEVFVFYVRCSQLDGMCRFDAEHSTVAAHEFLQIGEIPGNRPELRLRTTCCLSSCGACALYALSSYENLSLKIASRGLSAATKLKTVRFLVSLIDLLDQKRISFEDFHQEARRRFPKYYDRACSDLMCFYPSGV